MSAVLAALPLPEESSERKLAEFTGRLVIATALGAMLFAVLTPLLASAGAWSGQELRVLPRLTVFGLAAVTILCLQGSRTSAMPFVLLGGILLAANFALLNGTSLGRYQQFYVTQQVLRAAAAGDPLAANPGTLGAAMLSSGPLLQWLAFQTSILAAVLLGLAMGRELRTHGDLLALLVCAAAGSLWLEAFKVPDATRENPVLQFLRVSWPVRVGQLPVNAAFTDILFFSALMEGGRLLKFPMPPLLLGALAGYFGASFFALEPWPGWPALSMLMCGGGVVIACWPELKWNVAETGRAFLLGSVLLVLLFGMSLVYRKLHPQPHAPPDASFYKTFTQKKAPRQFHAAPTIGYSCSDVS